MTDAARALLRPTNRTTVARGTISAKTRDLKHTVAAAPVDLGIVDSMLKAHLRRRLLAGDTEPLLAPLRDLVNIISHEAKLRNKAGRPKRKRRPPPPTAE